MKRIWTVLLVVCLLFCGCQAADLTSTESTPENSQAPTQVTTEAPTGTSTEAPTEAPTEPTQTQPEKITVYLLTETMFCDNGRSEYFYDENHNIDSRKDYDIENQYRGSVSYVEKDAGGMPCMIWEQYAGWDDAVVHSLTYFADGKLKEEQLNANEWNYTGWQYEYDQKGDVTEKREYYEGILQSTVIYEYDGDELIRVYCEDPQGTHIYDCRVENGVIVEKVIYSTESMEGGSYRYEYDDNGNLVTEYILIEGELMPNMTYGYKAVEVDAECAGYLLKQQAYLLSIT